MSLFLSKYKASGKEISNQSRWARINKIVIARHTLIWNLCNCNKNSLEIYVLEMDTSLHRVNLTLLIQRVDKVKHKIEWMSSFKTCEDHTVLFGDYFWYEYIWINIFKMTFFIKKIVSVQNQNSNFLTRIINIMTQLWSFLIKFWRPKQLYLKIKTKLRRLRRGTWIRKNPPRLSRHLNLRGDHSIFANMNIILIGSKGFGHRSFRKV